MPAIPRPASVCAIHRVLGFVCACIRPLFSNSILPSIEFCKTPAKFRRLFQNWRNGTSKIFAPPSCSASACGLAQRDRTRYRLSMIGLETIGLPLLTHAGAHDKDERERGPSEDGPALLGFKLSRSFDMRPRRGRATLRPPTSDLRPSTSSLASLSQRWRATAGSAGQRLAKVWPKRRRTGTSWLQAFAFL